MVKALAYVAALPEVGSSIKDQIAEIEAEAREVERMAEALRQRKAVLKRMVASMDKRIARDWTAEEIAAARGVA